MNYLNKRIFPTTSVAKVEIMFTSTNWTKINNQFWLEVKKSVTLGGKENERELKNSWENAFIVIGCWELVRYVLKEKVFCFKN